MMKIRLAALAGAALMGLATTADAQVAAASPDSSNSAFDQCWDVNANMARNRSQTNPTNTASGGKPISSTTAVAGSGWTFPTPDSGRSSTGGTSARRTGMPNC